MEVESESGDCDAATRLDETARRLAAIENIDGVWRWRRGAMAVGELRTAMVVGGRRGGWVEDVECSRGSMDS